MNIFVCQIEIMVKVQKHQNKKWALKKKKEKENLRRKKNIQFI